MKKRYHGIATAVIGLVAMGAVGGFYGSGVWQIPMERPAGRLAPDAMGRIKVPSTDQVHQMTHLYGRLEQLASPSARTRAAQSLTLFGYRDDRLADRDADDAPDGSAGWDLRLTLTVLAGIRNYCILGGDFLAEGAAMASGGQIVKIEAHRVLVARGQERRWIYLDDDQAVSAVTNEPVKAAPGKGRS